MLRKTRIGILLGVGLFCFGFIWDFLLREGFEPIMIDNFPLSMWITPILLGSGLSLTGISLMYELIGRRYS